MKTLALRLAALLLTAAASVSADAAVLFDNLDAATMSMSLSESSAHYTDRRFANRIPVSPTPMRIESVQIGVYIFNGLRVEVCDTSPASTSPYAGPCTLFTPDGAADGLRNFSGNHTVAEGNVAWVVMSTPGLHYPNFTVIYSQYHSDYASGLAYSTDNGSSWTPSKATTYGMRIHGIQPPVVGACGSAHGVSVITTAPTGTAACAAGTLNPVDYGPSQFTWQCQGSLGGGNAQCSAPRGYTVQTQASGGGSIDAGYVVTGGQTATFHLTIPPNHTASASGCNGTLVGNTFTTGEIYSDCTVSAVFTPNTHTIATYASGGMVICTPNPVPHGQDAYCTAMANPGYQFTGWHDACHGAGIGPCQLSNVTSVRYVSATFQFITHPIHIAPASGGMVSCTPSPVPHSQAATCGATPLSGHHFVGWTGDCASFGSNSMCHFPSVSAPLSVSATFAPDAHAIATPATTGGAVTCTPNPVNHGQDASCTATPDAGYHFTGWSGDCTGTGACHLPNVTGPRSVSATFALNSYAISITPAAVNGTVTCTPNPVTHGQDASCTATPDTGYHLTGWTGDCSGTGACQLTNVTGPRNVGATFALNSYAISITPAAVNGTVTCTPNPVTHGLDTSCTATPDTGYHFTGWSGDCSGTGACQLTNVTGPRSVGATFALNAYPINVSPTPANGTVTCSPNPVTHGQDASCTATPAADYHLTGWTGDCSGTGACQLTNVTGPRSVSATFALNAYPINVSPTPANGTVACSPNPVTHGQDASCTATPDAGYHLTGWSGDCSGTGACQFTNVTSPRSVSATFAHNPVDASCGSAANGAVAFKPSANLCATGTPGVVLSASGQYTWQCNSEHGGAAQQCSAPWQGAGGNGNLGTVEVDSANGWEIRSAAFAATLPAPLPPHARAVHAPLGLVLGQAAGSGDAQVTVRFTQPVPPGAVYYKYGPSPEGLGCTGAAACAQPHWYALPGAQFAPDGLSVTFTLADGGVGDSDSVPHQITDPGVPVLLASPAPQAIPALGPWALALLSLLAAGLGAARRRTLL